MLALPSFGPIETIMQNATRCGSVVLVLLGWTVLSGWTQTESPGSLDRQLFTVVLPAIIGARTPPT